MQHPDIPVLNRAVKHALIRNWHDSRQENRTTQDTNIIYGERKQASRTNLANECVVFSHRSSGHLKEPVASLIQNVHEQTLQKGQPGNYAIAEVLSGGDTSSSGNVLAVC